MSFDMKPLEELGAKIAEALGDGPSEDQILIQRRDFLAHLTTKINTPRMPRYQRAAVVAAAAAVIAAVLGIVFKWDGHEPLPFWIGNDNTTGMEGQWVRAESTALLPVRFQGGSEVDLTAESAARIIASTTAAVRIDLATGEVHCSINGNHKTKWQVEAGPYTVQVTGTAFTTAWNPDGSKLDVTVTRGSVLVTGADLSAHGIQLSEGDHLQVDGEKALIALNPELTDEVLVVDENEISADTDAVVPDLEEVEDAPADATSASGTRHVYSKRNALKKPGAVLRLEDNLDKILAEGDVEQLWQIAMQARYNRNGGTAETVLLTIRDRFKNSKRAETAAFLLGRVSLELQGNPSDAARWFKRYLDETPGGPLAEESLGRLIDAHEKAGHMNSAKQYAKRYLSLYPSGLFADSAKQVLKN